MSAQFFFTFGGLCIGAGLLVFVAAWLDGRKR